MSVFLLLCTWLVSSGELLKACDLGLQMHEYDQINMRLVPANLPAVLEVQANASSCLVREEGVIPHFLNWIARRFNIIYSWELKGAEKLTIEDSPSKKGLVSFIRNGEADVIAGGITPTVERFHAFDFTFPWWVGSFVLMIPYPVSKINQKALIQPFQLEVWLLLLFGFSSVITSWFLISRAYTSKTYKPKSLHKIPMKRKLFRPFEYAFSVLLSQGNFCLETQLSIRLIASVWCLGAFVLYPAYSGTLISFIMSPTIKPIVNSIRDIENVPGLSIAVDRGMATDVIFQAVQNHNSSSYERLVNNLKQTMLRCNDTRRCLDGVRSERFVYAHTLILVNNVIYNEKYSTGMCAFTRAKEPFQAAFIAMGVVKKSIFSRIINKGILEMHAAGLQDYWNAKYFKEAKECMKIDRTFKKKKLSLPELNTTFLLLGTGSIVGLIFFFFELLRANSKKHN